MQCFTKQKTKCNVSLDAKLPWITLYFNVQNHKMYKISCQQPYIVQHCIWFIWKFLVGSQLGLMAHTHLDSPACQGKCPYPLHCQLQLESVCASKVCCIDIGTSFSDAEGFLPSLIWCTRCTIQMQHAEDLFLVTLSLQLHCCTFDLASTNKIISTWILSRARNRVSIVFKWFTLYGLTMAKKSDVETNTTAVVSQRYAWSEPLWFPE